MRHKLHLYLIYMLSFDDRRMRQQNKFSKIFYFLRKLIYIIRMYTAYMQKGWHGRFDYISEKYSNIQSPSTQNVLM